jgi:hypothetical protein
LGFDLLVETEEGGVQPEEVDEARIFEDPLVRVSVSFS